jgi:long-chain acyl-CoA synthetase
LLQRNAAHRARETAVVYGATRVSNAELLDRVERCARGLVALGVRPGDRVALLLENSPEFLISFFGIAACRGVVVPLNLDFKDDELRFYLGDAGARCLVVDAARATAAQRIAAALPQPPLVIVNGAPVAGAHSLAVLLAQAPAASLPDCALDDEIIYIYSSGSTGRPKCVPRTVAQYCLEMQAVIECLQLDRRDTIFCMIPLFHNFGAVHCMLASIGSGARLVILDGANPFALHRSRAIKLIAQQRVTILPGVPFMFGHLASTSSDCDLSSVRICYSAGAAVTPEIAESFRARFKVPIRNHYGCTEVGVMTINLDADPRKHDESVGRAFPGVRIRILDDAGRDLPAGKIGEIVVSSPAMTSGYRGAGKESRALFRDGFFHTGDLGTLDADGRLYLRGRSKFVIDVVGHKVSPIEIEDVLARHPAVRESVVLGIPNADGNGEHIKAYVAASDECAVAELLRFCRERLANFKIPQAIEFIREVPKNSLGKTLRKREILDALRVRPEPRDQEVAV